MIEWLGVALQVIGAVAVARYTLKCLRALLSAPERKSRDWYEKPIFPKGDQT